MNFEHQFAFPLPNGLHARPASHLQELANRFDAAITLVNQRTNCHADAKSVLSLVGADVKANDLCTLLFSGTEAELAFSTVTSYLANEFLGCDEALPEQENRGEAFIPRSLRASGLTQHYSGTPVCRGIGCGRVVLLGRPELPESLRNQTAADPAHEQQLFDSAVTAACKKLQQQITLSTGSHEGEMLKMHCSILQDKFFISSVHEKIHGQRLTAGQAIMAAADQFCEKLLSAENHYLRERVLDMQDVSTQLLGTIYGEAFGLRKPKLSSPSVCVAENLTPGQFLALDRSCLQALVLGHAGTTSHTVILARAFNVPTIVGVGAAVFRANQEIIVDADRGLVIPEVTPELAAYYERERSKAARIHARVSGFQTKPALTIDGRHLEIAANVVTAEEADAVFQAGADGIGLFRTEMLFMDREHAPSEEEQCTIYTAMAKAAAGRPVIIRTFDIGGDKPVPYLGLPAETNPFLGYRGVRIYAEFADILKAQLRAILRAAEHGTLKIMIPMVSSVEEVRLVKLLLQEAREDLRLKALAAADAPIELGIMLEVPSVAFLMPQLCREVDFFSIGTNDLIQYFTAVDRENAKVAPLYSARHPGFLRLLQKLASEARAAGKWIGLCGQVGEDAKLLPLLIGLGIDEISVSAPRISALKADVCAASASECESLLRQVLDCATQEEVQAHLHAFHSTRQKAPIITPELVIVDSDATTKEQAIKQLCDALHIAGRTDNPDRVEEEVWAREDTYSTGFGGGFSIPHCKSAHLKTHSIAVLKTRTGSAGIPWQSLDGNPVHIVVLLGMQAESAGKAHLAILATISRQIMRDEFRQKLTKENDPEELASFLLSGLPR